MPLMKPEEGNRVHCIVKNAHAALVEASESQMVVDPSSPCSYLTIPQADVSRQEDVEKV